MEGPRLCRSFTKRAVVNASFFPIDFLLQSFSFTISSRIFVFVQSETFPTQFRRCLFSQRRVSSASVEHLDSGTGIFISCNCLQRLSLDPARPGGPGQHVVRYENIAFVLARSLWNSGSRQSGAEQKIPPLPSSSSLLLLLVAMFNNNAGFRSAPSYPLVV